MDKAIWKNQLIEQLRSEDREAVNKLYELAFFNCSSFVTNNNGTREDARDIFQEALFVLIKNIRKSNFEIKYSLKAYLLGITRNLWLKHLKKNKTDLTIDEKPVEIAMIDDNEIQQKKELEEKHKLLYSCMKRLKADCRKLLELTFYEKMPDKEIAPVLAYSLEFVRQKRRRCIKGLKKLMIS